MSSLIQAAVPLLVLIFGGAVLAPPATAEPCICPPVRDVRVLPDEPTELDRVIARLEILDFNIVDQDAAVLEIELEDRIIDLTIVTTDTPGNEVDQVQFYEIGQLPPGRYTFRLFVAGLNPPPPQPPIPLVYTTTLDIRGLGGVPVPALGWWGILVLIGAVAVVALRCFPGRTIPVVPASPAIPADR